MAAGRFTRPTTSPTNGVIAARVGVLELAVEPGEAAGQDGRTGARALHVHAREAVAPALAKRTPSSFCALASTLTAKWPALSISVWLRWLLMTQMSASIGSRLTLVKEVAVNP